MQQATSGKPPGGGRIALVEFGRGIAALLVLLVHAGGMMRPEQYSGQPAFDDLFSKGFVGVDFFFVLSGFIICYVHYRDMNCPERLPRYAWRRLTRVLPTYWVVFIAALAMNLLLQREKATVTPVWLVEQWFMVPPAQLFVGPAWTLQFELLFYTLFATVLLNRRLGLALLGLWFVTVHAVRLLHGDVGDALDDPSWLKMLVHPYNNNFLLGMALGLAMRQGRGVRLLTLAFAAVSAAFLITWANTGIDWHNYPRFIGVGFICATILGVLLLLSPRVSTLPDWMTFLGAISYSLYLSHIFTVGYFYAVAARLGLFAILPQEVLFFMALGVAMLTSWLLYRLVEKPVLAWAHRVVP